MDGYTVIARFRDLEDGHLYEIGDVFPCNGREVSLNRIAELSDTHNKAGYALIAAVLTEEEEIPAETPKPARRRQKTVKKAV